MADKIFRSLSFDDGNRYIPVVHWENVEGKPSDIGGGGDGRGIVAIGKTASNGLVDTYTILYTDNTTSTFTVTNGEDGESGVPGSDGAPGKDGVSPTITVTTIIGGYRLTIADSKGTKTVDIMDGVDGQSGKDGRDGRDGTSVTHYWNGTSLVVTSASGTSSMNLKGETGVRGPQGDTGMAGVDGKDGSDGYTPVKGVDYFDGKDGSDGFSPEVAITPDKDGHTVTITSKTGSKSFKVTDGADGVDGRAGKDGSDGSDGTCIWTCSEAIPENVSSYTVNESTIGVAKGYTLKVGDLVIATNGLVYKVVAIGSSTVDLGYMSIDLGGEDGERGADGQRGTGILKVTTAPTSYTTTTNGVAPIKRMAISTIKTQAGVDEVLVGDCVCYSYYLYHVYYLDATYAYMDKSQSIRGATGAAGAAGAAGKDGEDYVLTDADKAEIADIVAVGDIPDYWQTELDTAVETIRRAMESAGRNKSSFFFYSDAHWSNDGEYTAKLEPTLLKYLYKKTPINKTNFGGDIVFGEGSTDTANMTYLWDWREQLRGLPNHHSVVGNHEDGNDEMDRQLSKEYVYSYLFAPEESNDIVWGGDFYYYIDNNSERTRYLYLDTFYDGVSSAQVEFVKEALLSTPTDWHIIAISHAWYDQGYASYPPTISGFYAPMQTLLNMFDSYNARSGEYSDCGGWVELCIGGHYHLDHYTHTEGGIPVIIVEAGTIHDRGGSMPQKGTTDESTVSAIVVDYNEMVVKVIRIGRGESYTVPINRTAPVAYTNVIPTSIGTDGNVFNSGKGWANNSRIGSGGIYLGNGSYYVTGHIPIDRTKDLTIYLKNVTFGANSAVAFFDASFARLSSGVPSDWLKLDNIKQYCSGVVDGSGNLTQFTMRTSQMTNTALVYMAIQADYLGDDSVITINEPITD